MIWFSNSEASVQSTYCQKVFRSKLFSCKIRDAEQARAVSGDWRMDALSLFLTFSLSLGQRVHLQENHIGYFKVLPSFFSSSLPSSLNLWSRDAEQARAAARRQLGQLRELKDHYSVERERERECVCVRKRERASESDLEREI